MEKFRIKQEFLTNGVVNFRPERRRVIWWYDIGDECIIYSSKDEAQVVIDKYRHSNPEVIRTVIHKSN
jgi:hypothetical protein